VVFSLTVAIVGIVMLVSGIFFDWDLFDGWLSSVTVGTFLALTGFLTIIVSPANVFTVMGVLAVSVVAAIGARTMMNVLARTDTTPSPTLDSVVGTVGVVTGEILANSMGQVAVKTVDGTPLRLSAVSDTSVELQSEVLVTEILSATLVRVTTRF